MRGAGDRDLAVVEIGALPHEQERLNRLGRGAEKRHEPRIAGLRDDAPAVHRDSVHGVDRLDDAAPRHLDLDRVGHSGETTP